MSDYNEILKYIKNTPENTNPAIVKSMLDNREKPAGGPAGNVVNITNNSSGTPVIFGDVVTPDGLMCTSHAVSIPSGNSQWFLYNQFESDQYWFVFNIGSASDIYSVVVNNTPLTYSKGGYAFVQPPETGPITGQTFNVVITDKESQEGHQR